MVKLKNPTGNKNKYKILTDKGNEYYSINEYVEVEDKEDIAYLLERGFKEEKVKKSKVNKGDE